ISLGFGNSARRNNQVSGIVVNVTLTLICYSSHGGAGDRNKRGQSLAFVSVLVPARHRLALGFLIPGFSKSPLDQTRGDPMFL
ncbi:hypothetical protein WA026_003296, partial [Henosepilachna vigintioctopunctata]